MSQARNWVYTLNNPTVTLEQANAALREINSFLFHACQLERGESGTLHIQGYVQFSRPVRLTQLTARLMGAHWETRRGSHQQALTYVTKAESRVSGPFQDGEATKPVKGRVPISQTLSQLWKPTACKALFLDIPKPSSVMELDSCVCTFIENFSPVIGPDLSSS